MISEPAIDKRTEEKMFFGTLPPEDAPPELARVAVLLRAAAAPRLDAESGSLISDTEKLRQQHVVTAMAAVIAATPAAAPAAVQGHKYWKGMSALRPRRDGSLAPGHRFWKVMSALRPRGAARLAVVMAMGLMILSAGMAFAGVLPNPVLHAASALFSKVGIHVPDGSGGVSSPVSVKEPGSPSGHAKVTGSGDQGNGKDRGKHTGQEKNGNRGLHKGQAKNGHEGNHGHSGKGNGGKGHTGDDSGKGSKGESGSSGDGHSGDNGHSSGGGHSGDGGDSGGDHGDNGGGGHSGHDSLTASTP
jgi:hypothetical protein